MKFRVYLYNFPFSERLPFAGMSHLNAKHVLWWW